MATSQHRCVFVGNIPYDATEEQLVEICQEVGPVVSFRLVIDRETGKPKGYGFCEYKDEETALSARRNLQGYDINGRQLRVDFAENDKGLDRGREQGRGGPGLPPTSSVDPSKKAGASTIRGDSALHQPIGPQIALNAQAVMAGALGSAQGQLASTNDPLTLHLAKFSRNQLNEIMSEMKLMATQNKESARQLLLARPQLSKAIFQAQIMLGMVTPQVLQMPNLAQSSLQSGLLPKAQEGQLSNVPQNERTQFPIPLQLPSQPFSQIQQQQLAIPGSYSTFPPPQPHSSSIPHIQALNQQMQLPAFQNLPAGVVTSGHSTQMLHSNATLLPRQSLPDTRYQPGPSIPSGTSQPMSNNTNTNLPLRLAERASSVEINAPPSKMLKLADGTKLKPTLNLNNANGSIPLHISGVASSSANAVSKLETLQSRKQISQQAQLPSGVEPGLLQQVLSLTPEQLSLLSPEQQQQVMQLQQMLRQEQL